MNILTIDVEDYYCDIDISAWDSYEHRVVQNTNKVLDILSETNTRATFFVLGYVAEHFPELVKSIKAKNHEVATHTYSHTPITRQTPLEFEKDLSKSISILEKITGDKIFGFRAPPI